MLNQKKGFEFSFQWIFAIVAGAFIIMIAIYATISFIKSSQNVANTETAAKLSVFFEPMETGAGMAGKSPTPVIFSDEAKIYNECDNDNNFGENQIQLSVKSGFLSSQQEPGNAISIPNKYLFSQKIVQGKKIYLFSKSIRMPFKLSDAIIFYSNTTCFEEQSTPNFIREEFPALYSLPEGCPEDGILVCFGHAGSKCAIEVYGQCSSDCDSERGKYDYGLVKNKLSGKTVSYAGDLIYPAIYSESEIYKCNVKRLMNRLKKQCLMYIDESKFLASSGFGVPHISGFLELISQAQGVYDSNSIKLASPEFVNAVKELDRLNYNSECNLW